MAVETVETLTRLALIEEGHAAIKRGVGHLNPGQWTINDTAGTLRDRDGALIAYVNPWLFRAPEAAVGV